MGRLTARVLGSAAGEVFRSGTVAARHAGWRGRVMRACSHARREAFARRVFKADAIAAKRCTGEVTFAELVDELAKSYAAPRDKILADVGTLLWGLADKRLLEL